MAGRNDERFVAQSSAPRMCAFGALRLCYGDVEIVVAGMSGRVLTALLWRRAGLSVEQLVDVVWLNDPPKSARAALHVHLGTVRRSLADTPGGAAVERSGGVYRLRLDGWEVDIDIVESLTERRAGRSPIILSLRRSSSTASRWPPCRRKVGVGCVDHRERLRPPDRRTLHRDPEIEAISGVRDVRLRAVQNYRIGREWVLV